MVKPTVSKLNMILFSALVVIVLSGSGVQAMALVQSGSKGNRVVEVQNYLYQLSYLKTRPTGYFGSLTREAVKSFQLENNLKVDGVVGPETLNLLREAVNRKNKVVEYIVKPGDDLERIAAQYETHVSVIMARNNLPGNQIAVGQKLIIPVGVNPVPLTTRNRPGGIQAIPWSIVNQLWKNGEVARILDLETGRSFQAKRLYGYYHADIEPLTREDTRIMKEIYGGKWSWDRRAVAVQIRNLLIAASINGMPHGGQSIYDNDFQGQFCAHFLGSKVHKSGKVDRLHYDMIEKAAGSTISLGKDVEQPITVPQLEEADEE